MTLKIKDKFSIEPLPEEEFSILKGIMEEINHFKELTPDELFSKITKISMDSLICEDVKEKEMQLWSIFLILEAHFHEQD